MSFRQIFLPYIDTLGGTGVWNWVQNIHNCGAGDTLWDFEQLGVGSDLLDWRSDGGYLKITHKNSIINIRFSLRKQANGL